MSRFLPVRPLENTVLPFRSPILLSIILTSNFDRAYRDCKKEWVCFSFPIFKRLFRLTLLDGSTQGSKEGCGRRLV